MTTNILASAARTASGVSQLPGLFDDILAGLFLLTVSAAATEAGDTLDVYIQSSADGGTTWNDFIHFTQVLGNGGAKKFLATWQPLAAAETELAAPGDAALAAGVVHNIQGSVWRVKWVIADSGNANQSFTFKVDADMMGRKPV